jgi:hypothetical protein
MPRTGVPLFAVVMCLLCLAAAVVSFVEGSLLGIVWILLAGLSSNMAWYYIRKERAARSA